MTDWDHTTDFLLIGSGAGLVGALRAAAHGKEVLVVEKSDLVGGSTCMSGGVLWLPDNPLMAREGVTDSLQEALTYFDTVVGDADRASSFPRRTTYVTAGKEMLGFLEQEGLSFLRCDGYSDYYAGVRGVQGGSVRGRSVECAPFDAALLGPWQERLRPSIAGRLALLTGEVATLVLLRRSASGKAAVARVAARTVWGRLRGKVLVTNGASLIGRLLHALLERGVPVWTESSLEDLVVEDGRVVGAVVRRRGRLLRVRARDGVLLAAGGFAHNRQMREQFSGAQPNRAEWSAANPGDTGEVLRIAMEHGAATDMLDEAVWLPAALLPDGSPAFLNGERSKPGSVVVDGTGERYLNEAIAYQEAGQLMYRREAATGAAIPSWLIIDSRHRSRYMFAGARPGKTPRSWIDSGFLRRSDTLEGLAEQCGIDALRLRATVDRFNGWAATGVDQDFHRGEGAHEQYQGDHTHRPNPCLGALDKPPFYAVALYPGDVGTVGGLVCDEHARVLDRSGVPLPGLYAAGNGTASVMGRKYLGAGASIGNSAVFAYVAADHASSAVELAAASRESA